MGTNVRNTTCHLSTKYSFSYDQAWLLFATFSRWLFHLQRLSNWVSFFKRFFFAPCGIWLRNWGNLALLSCLSGKCVTTKSSSWGSSRQLVGCNGGFLTSISFKVATRYPLRPEKTWKKSWRSWNFPWKKSSSLAKRHVTMLKWVFPKIMVSPTHPF